MRDNVSVGKYVLRFAIVYSIATITVSAIMLYFNIGNGYINHVLIILAAMMASEKFIKVNKRTPNKSEKIRLIGYSFLVYCLYSLVLAGGASLFSPEILLVIMLTLSSLSVGVFAVIFMTSILTVLLMLWLSYGFLTSQHYKRLEKKGKL